MTASGTRTLFRPGCADVTHAAHAPCQSRGVG